MRRTAITTSVSTEVMRRLRHFGDFVTVPLVLAPAWFAFENGQYRLRRPWRVRKDEKALAARPGVDDSLCVRRGGDGDRRLLLAVLDGRVTAYSKQATAKFNLGHEGLKQRLGAHRNRSKT